MAKPLKWVVKVAIYETQEDVLNGNCLKKVNWENIAKEEQIKMADFWKKRAMERIYAGSGYKIVDKEK